MNFKSLITEAVQLAIQKLFSIDVESATLQVSPTNKDQDGHFTFLVFPLSKYKLGKPEEVGTAIASEVCAQNPEWVKNFTVVKGFVNFELTGSAWGQYLQWSQNVGDQFFTSQEGKGQRVMVEFASPNTNKPLHLGHLRNIFLGDSVANLLSQCGYEAIRVCLFNDKGVHICKSMYAYLNFNPEGYQNPDHAQMKGDHLVAMFYVRFEKEYQKEVSALVAQGMPKEEAIKKAPLMVQIAELYRQWEAQNPEVIALWQTMNSWVYEGMHHTFENLQIQFDKFYYESQTYLLGKDIVQEGLEKQVFYQKEDTSVWIDLTDAKLDHKVLLRSDGTTVYMTQDLGTADLKYQDYHIDKSVYVIANEQDYHMKVLIEILKRMGKPYANGVYHLSYGMVELPEGRMKTREGNVVDADDLIQEMRQTAEQTTETLGKTEGLSTQELNTLYQDLALGAIKYFLLRVDPTRNMIFNPKESIDFKGHTGTFIQFNGARMNSILKKATQNQLSFAFNPKELNPNEFEIAVMRKIHQYLPELSESCKNYNPAGFANYIYELAREYSRFYNECPVLTDKNPETVGFRLSLTAQCHAIIVRGMKILGINVPERM